ncbi:hypothetical protein G6F60_014717 [Rhizopus arrhizus]|nr:hypothetical protein G6F60_014717 [Rhizopus arrhizus]
MPAAGPGRSPAPRAGCRRPGRPCRCRQCPAAGARPRDRCCSSGGVQRCPRQRRCLRHRRSPAGAGRGRRRGFRPAPGRAPAAIAGRTARSRDRHPRGAAAVAPGARSARHPAPW